MRIYTETGRIRGASGREALYCGDRNKTQKADFGAPMKRILLVEDEARLARLISRVLGEEGYAAETAGDGCSGLARALTESFDLLILDWMLPTAAGCRSYGT